MGKKGTAKAQTPGAPGEQSPEYTPGERGPGSPGAKAEDNSKPLPDATDQVPDKPGASVAPDVNQAVPQGDLVRRLDEMLKEDKVTPELEKRLGMTKDQMQQFVKKYEQKGKRPAARKAQDIASKPGQEQSLDPNRKAPEFQPGVTASGRNERASSNLNDDANAGLAEGSLSTAPPELRKRFEAYKSSLGRSSTGGNRSSTSSPMPLNPAGSPKAKTP